MDTGNLEKHILFLGLSFPWPRMGGDRCHNSQGGLTVRNNPKTQGLHITEVSHSCNISMWVSSRSLPHSDLGKLGILHLVALPFSRASESTAGLILCIWLADGGRERVNNCAAGFMGLAWKWQPSDLLTSHWPELSHVVIPNCKGAWEM